MINIDSQFNYVFSVLSSDQVDQINKAEGNGVGSAILAQLVDMALSGSQAVVAESQVTGLVADLAARLQTAKLVAYQSSASAGGAATENYAVAGLLATDFVLSVTPLTAPANAVYMNAVGIDGSSHVAADGVLPVTYSGDPGAGGKVLVLVRKV